MDIISVGLKFPNLASEGMVKVTVTSEDENTATFKLAAHLSLYCSSGYSILVQSSL